MDAYLEIGVKRVFAAAVDWPGWCRSGRDEESALAALSAYGRRYREALAGAAVSLQVPTDSSALRVVERVPGNATTDFGVPGAIPAADREPTDERELDRLIALLRSAWQAFDRAQQAAEGRLLAVGPRGGGRSLDKIREHVIGADASYLTQLGGRASEGGGWAAFQDGLVDALRARSAGEIADIGSRGGRRWPARYAVRRSAWHALDHAWEIEDRAGLVDPV